jgi:hypothetical protein
MKNLSWLGDKANIFRKIGRSKMVDMQNVHVMAEFGRRNKKFCEELVAYFPFTVI